MELLDLLKQAQSGQSLGAIGEQFGLSEQQTAAAIEQLAPVIAAGVRRNMAQSPDNVASLIQALQKGDHDQYLDNPDSLKFGNVASDGNAILGHVFGSKEVSREVAMRAAGSVGIGDSIMKKLMPVVASMVIGSLTKKMFGGGATTRRAAPASQGGGVLGDILGQVLGGGSSSRGGGLGGALGGALGGGGLGDILGQVLGGGSSSGRSSQRSSAPSSQGGGLDDLLNDVLGNDETIGRGYNEEVITRSRDTLDDFLGGGSSNGRAADDLLGSVDDFIRRM